MSQYLPYLLVLAANASSETTQAVASEPHVVTTGERVVMGIVAVLIVSFIMWFTRPREY